MRPQLTATQARVIGCLMEKSVVTPDQYPLTLNALTNACNQKSARNPVMALRPGEVQRAARELQGNSLLHIEENVRTGMEKYRQRFCNTRYNDLQLSPPQFAIVCLLLLRGPQTPGELRARSGRLYAFADNAAVVDAMADLVTDESDSLVVALPRTPGRKDAEYMHQLCGTIDIEAYPSQNASTGSVRADVPALQRRVRELEAEVARLKAALAARE